MGSLLPPSIRDARTLALEGLLDRLDALPLDLLRTLYDPARCPVEALPFLASQWGVLNEVWALARSEAEQRALVGKALLWQRHRGTPWALSQVLGAAGWPGGVVEERIASDHQHDRSFKHDGSVCYGGRGGWACFRVCFELGSRAISAADVACFRAAVDAWSPAGRRCVELRLRVRLAGGLLPGKSAADAVRLVAGSCSRPVLLTGTLAQARIRRFEASGEDLRTFHLVDATGVTGATLARDIPLLHTEHTLLVGWSLA